MKATGTTAGANTTVGEIVAADFRTAEVFERHGIDFCCGGNVPLAAACGEKGIDVETLKAELAEATARTAAGVQDYAAWELPTLAEHIVATHHAYLNEETPRIAAYARKIAEVHGERHPEVIEIARIFSKISVDMEGHLREEEEVLFPAVKRIDAAVKEGGRPAPEDVKAIADSLLTLGREHEAIGDAVHEIRRLSGSYALPADVCTTFALTYRLLKEFEDDLHRHVHLENNILFPKAARH
jgi:regulator of cell morphogenesis and NO signaling